MSVTERINNFRQVLENLLGSGTKEARPVYIKHAGEFSNEDVKKMMARAPESYKTETSVPELSATERQMRDDVAKRTGRRVDEHIEYLVSRRNERTNFGRRGR